MTFAKSFVTFICLAICSAPVMSREDVRELLELPAEIEAQLFADMRAYVAAVDDILNSMAREDWKKAASIAENRLGMRWHQEQAHRKTENALPEGMQAAGLQMHKAASEFAEVARQAKPGAARRALSEISMTCVACHIQYRLR